MWPARPLLRLPDPPSPTTDRRRFLSSQPPAPPPLSCHMHTQRWRRTALEGATQPSRWRPLTTAVHLYRVAIVALRTSQAAVRLTDGALRGLACRQQQLLPCPRCREPSCYSPPVHPQPSWRYSYAVVCTVAHCAPPSTDDTAPASAPALDSSIHPPHGIPPPPTLITSPSSIPLSCLIPSPHDPPRRILLTRSASPSVVPCLAGWCGSSLVCSSLLSSASAVCAVRCSTSPRSSSPTAVRSRVESSARAGGWAFGPWPSTQSPTATAST